MENKYGIRDDGRIVALPQSTVGGVSRQGG